MMTLITDTFVVPLAALIVLFLHYINVNIPQPDVETTLRVVATVALGVFAYAKHSHLKTLQRFSRKPPVQPTRHKK